MKALIANRLVKGFAAFLLLASCALLAGCPGNQTFRGMTEPLHAPVVVENEDAAAKAYRLAHYAIDEANGALTAANTVIGDNAANHVWSKKKAQKYLDQSIEYGKDLDKARKTLRIGNIADATVQAEAAKKLIFALQAEIARQAGDQ